MIVSNARVCTSVLALACIALVHSSASAQEPDPPFAADVFPPDLVMENADEISLRDDQRESITSSMRELEEATAGLEGRIEEAAAELARELKKGRVDEAVALAAAEQVMSIEGQFKRAYLVLLIQIKNQLEPDQQKRLREIRSEASS